jgi:kumamolisin
MYQKIASDKTADVVSISWGSCEAEEGKAQAQAVNQALETGTAEGISYFAAAGDDGAADCFRATRSTARAVDFPASSPAVTAVGGTKLSVTSTGAYTGEVVWNDGAAGGATGGGVSTLFGAPSYQKSLGGGGRQVPDVAADAAPATGYRIFSQGKSIVVGGTSGAAPLWASFAALQNEVHGWPLGNLNPALYRIGTGSSRATGFNDVTSGDNSHDGATGFKARRGYDEVTGWGSFRGAALSKLLS